LPAAVIVASLALVVVPVAAVHRDRARGNVGSVIVTADAAAALIVRAVEAVARIVVIIMMIPIVLPIIIIITVECIHYGIKP